LRKAVGNTTHQLSLDGRWKRNGRRIIRPPNACIKPGNAANVRTTQIVDLRHILLRAAIISLLVVTYMDSR
jgi:hypothetical protein